MNQEEVNKAIHDSVIGEYFGMTRQALTVIAANQSLIIRVAYATVDRLARAHGLDPDEELAATARMLAGKDA